MKKRLPIFLLILSLLLVLVLAMGACSNTTSTSTTVKTTTTAAQPTTSTPKTTATTAKTTAAVTSTTTQATQTAVTLNVSAASSLTDAIKEINTLYTKNNPNVTLTPNFAGSGTLQKQIEQGAPADVFISAGASQMDALEKASLIVSSTRKNLLKNTLVLIVPADSTLGLLSFRDLAGEKVKQIAIGDPASVPAGKYAQSTFDELGLTSQLSGKYVIGADVKAVLSYVESGNVDAGLVYLTDARLSSKVKIVAFAPDDINAKIIYPAAVIAASKVSEAATKYENFLFGAEAKAIFEKYGFTVIGQ